MCIYIYFFFLSVLFASVPSASYKQWYVHVYVDIYIEYNMYIYVEYMYNRGSIVT